MGYALSNLRHSIATSTTSATGRAMSIHVPNDIISGRSAISTEYLIAPTFAINRACGGLIELAICIVTVEHDKLGVELLAELNGFPYLSRNENGRPCVGESSFEPSGDIGLVLDNYDKALECWCWKSHYLDLDDRTLPFRMPAVCISLRTRLVPAPLRSLAFERSGYRP